MTRPTILRVGAVALLVTASVFVGTPRVAHAALRTVASYQMNAASSSTLEDSGVFGLDGVLGTPDGSDVVTGVEVDGSTAFRWPYAAPDTSPLRPQRLAVVEAHEHLDPETADFAIEVRYRTTHEQGNIVQKGQSQTDGGYWKLEHDDGVPTCLFRRSLSDQASVTGDTNLADGDWHTVRCVRWTNSVRLYVDGVEIDRRNTSVGEIANDFDMTIGGKIDCDQQNVGCDYYSGDIDYVRIEKDVPGVPNLSPSAEVVADCVGLTCTLDSSASFDPDGSIVQRHLDIDDEATTVATTPVIEHTFPATGAYEVSVTVTDDEGASTKRTVTVVVEEPMSKFVPVPPIRVLDTRFGQSPPGYKGMVRGGTTRRLQVTGRAGVPSSGVTAVAINLTAVGVEAPSHVTASPNPVTESTTSSLNIVTPGQVRANLMIVPVGDGGEISLFSLRDAHLIGDIAGYFTSQPTATDDGRIVTHVPQRLFDTRTPGSLGPPRRLLAGEVVSTDVKGRAGIPKTAVRAVILNVTATDAAGPGFVTVWPGGARPLTSSLNTNGGTDTVANQVIVPVGADGRIRFSASIDVHLVADVLGWVTDDGAAVDTHGLFVPVEPARVFDTRPEELASGPKGRLADGGTISPLVGGRVGVPLTAGSVVLNVTVLGTGPGFVTLWPHGAPRPFTSNVNVDLAGDIRPNGAIVRLGERGRIDVYAFRTAHVLADVAGYLVD